MFETTSPKMSEERAWWRAKRRRERCLEVVVRGVVRWAAGEKAKIWGRRGRGR